MTVSNDDPSDYQPLVQRSGNFKTSSNLVAFIYEVLRDFVLPGDLEKAAQNSEKEHVSDADYLKPLWTLSNGWLAQYARDIVRRLILSDQERAAFKFVLNVLHKLNTETLNDEEKMWRATAIIRLERFVYDV